AARIASDHDRQPHDVYLGPGNLHRHGRASARGRRMRARNDRQNVNLRPVHRHDRRRRQPADPHADQGRQRQMPVDRPQASALRTHDLTKSYNGRTVVRGVSLDITSGEIVGLLGPNGAGKTTTFYMTVGLTAPDSGRVELNGADLTDDPMYIRARKGI